MNDPLRDRQPVGALASRGQVIEISNVIGDFSRLCDVVSTDLARLDPADVPADWRKLPVTGRLEFGPIAGDGCAARLDADLAATLVSVCQRCLAPFEWKLATTASLRLVATGETGAINDVRELWEVDGGETRPVDILDEVLVMALPLSARHENLDECVELGPGKQPDVASVETGATTTTPFAGLAEQMGIVKKD